MGVTNLSLTIQLEIKMSTTFLKLLMATSIMVSFVRSAHFDLKNAKDVNIMSNECLKSGSCRGVLFHGSAPPPPPSDGVAVSTTTNVQTRRKRADFNLQGSTGTKIQSNECETDGSCNGVRFHGPAPPASKGASVSTTTNVQTRRKRAEFIFGENSKPKILNAECKEAGSCKGVKFQDKDSSTYVDARGTSGNNLLVAECQTGGSCDGVSFHRQKRSDFNFGGNYDVNMQTNRCTGSGCDTTLFSIRNSESHAFDQSGINAMSQQSGAQIQNNAMRQSETQNIPVQEGEIVQARDGIRYKAYLYNTHL